MVFEDFPLSEGVRRAVAEIGYTEPTPIQAQSIPLILAGRDLIGRSNTGTGKTAAFSLPAIDRIDPETEGVQVLVLCPTRELAMQAAAEVEKFSRYTPWVRVAAVYGGASMERQIHQLKRGANFVIGTPGRVMDHLRRRTLRLSALRLAILDEADEMLDMGFREDIETILSQTPAERQTLLFSATMPEPILEIARTYQREPETVAVGGGSTRTAENIEQFYFDCPMGRKMDVLSLLLAAYDPARSIVFCNTKKMVDELTAYLTEAGYQAEGIHGDLRQSARTQVMGAFKAGRTRILIATDVAARGIDVENVDAVFNFDIPLDTEFYVHRIGRTARAGRSGRAFTLISGRRQFGQLRDIMAATGAVIQRQEIPSREEILARRREAFAAELAALAPSEGAEELLGRLRSLGLTDREAALGALTGWLSGRERALPEVQSVSRRDREGSSGVLLTIGRRQRIAPNFILGAIAEGAEIPGKRVGKIDIYDDYTLVQLSEEDARQVTERMSRCRINGHEVEIRPLGELPKRARGGQRGRKDAGRGERREQKYGRGFRGRPDKGRGPREDFRPAGKRRAQKPQRGPREG